MSVFLFSLRDHIFLNSTLLPIVSHLLFYRRVQYGNDHSLATIRIGERFDGRPLCRYNRFQNYTPLRRRNSFGSTTVSEHTESRKRFRDGVDAFEKTTVKSLTFNSF